MSGCEDSDVWAQPGTGRLQMNTAIATPTPPTDSRTPNVTGAKTAVLPITRARTRVAQVLARVRIAPSRSQSWIAGPRCGRDWSHLWQRGDVRAKQIEARIKNGVVGNRGSRRPRRPSKTQSHPLTSRAARSG